MGEYADDLIEKGLMEDHPFGYPPTHNVSTYKPVVVPEDTDILAFQHWYNKPNWDGCSRYEICGMAWGEAVRRCGNEPEDVDDDHFTWWFDDYRFKEIFTQYAMALMAWNEAKKRCNYAL